MNVVVYKGVTMLATTNGEVGKLGVTIQQKHAAKKYYV
jgi:hypothetical protein